MGTEIVEDAAVRNVVGNFSGSCGFTRDHPASPTENP